MMLLAFKQKSGFKKALMVLFLLGFVYCLVLVVRSYQFYLHNSTPTQINMAENKANDWHLYPFDVDFCLDDCRRIRDDFLVQDENDVYMVNFVKMKNLAGGHGTEYFPITIGLLSMVHHIRFHRYKDPEDRRLFFANADWFVNNLSPEGCWLFKFDYGLAHAPWCSGMAQGLGISTLVRAYRLSGEDKYLKGAIAAIGPFEADNGFTVASLLDNGDVFYEEVSVKEESIHILNGFMFALIGLWDLHQLTADPKVTFFYEQGMATLKNNMNRYDLGYWSLYSLDPISNLRNHYRVASPNYQRVHTQMFQAFYQMTGEPSFLTAFETHKSYLESSWLNLIIIPAYLTYQDLSLTVRFFRRLI